ncbi:hypothetical protein F7Q99_31275 [Streptomyces kaniharaensis]|uniref:Uncharacterized protein n=1 Tax=Streptomyces kaniharaensis TaxID=212423 RepID=A0A6N7L3W0_9ACTN|nr:hypothetical protein [Streptomyces kaniharaensis]MQS16553.1 hypothetical protein [Streptomyces kaniharaensis]
MSFLYPDQEEILDSACGYEHVSVERVASFPTPYGRRAVHAVGTPWAVLGALRAQVRRTDGGTPAATVEFPAPSGSTADYEHVCA